MFLFIYNPCANWLTRGRAVAARQAHNLKVVGSSPTPATTFMIPSLFEIKFPNSFWSLTKNRKLQLLPLW